MKLAPTMSKSGLLLQCAWPFDPERELPEDVAGEPADYGVAFHALLAAGLTSKFTSDLRSMSSGLAAKYNLFAPELWEHYSQAWPVLKKWLDGGRSSLDRNPWGAHFLRDGMQVEATRAFDVLTGKSRKAEPHNVQHVYPDRRPEEIIGTADLVIEAGNKILILDHKTGAGDFSSPGDNPQLLSLACAFAFSTKKKIIVAIFHAPRGGLPQVFAEEVTRGDLRAHAIRLNASVKRIGDGSLRVGPYCKYCPARAICPTRDVNLVEAITVAGGLVKQTSSALVTGEKIGQLHELLAEVEYHTIPRARDEIRKWVKAHPREVSTRPDGKVLAFVTRSFERLSKSSIVKALGKVDGEKELTRLRGLGCLTEDSREELHAVDNE